MKQPKPGDTIYAAIVRYGKLVVASGTVHSTYGEDRIRAKDTRHSTVFRYRGVLPIDDIYPTAEAAIAACRAELHEMATNMRIEADQLEAQAKIDPVVET